MKKFLLIVFLFFMAVSPCFSQSLRWQNFPLTVYIEFHPKKATVKQAFTTWQSLTRIAKFKYVNSEDADIIVKFTSTPQIEKSSQDPHLAGYTSYTYTNGYLNKAVITILSTRPGSTVQASDKYVYMVALHEIGHALGLPHSKNSNDVMYYLYSTQLLISPNDVNAFKALYSDN